MELFCSLSGNNSWKSFLIKKKKVIGTQYVKYMLILIVLIAVDLKIKPVKKDIRCGKDEECKHGLKMLWYRQRKIGEV